MTPKPDLFNYRVKLDRVVDGDTVDFVVDLGFHVTINQRFRVARVNCPEMSTPAGLAAKAFTMAWFEGHTSTKSDWPFTVQSTRKLSYDRYGRYLAFVLADDGHNLSDDLLAANQAVVYLS